MVAQPTATTDKCRDERNIDYVLSRSVFIGAMWREECTAFYCHLM